MLKVTKKVQILSGFFRNFPQQYGYHNFMLKNGMALKMSKKKINEQILQF